MFTGGCPAVGRVNFSPNLVNPATHPPWLRKNSPYQLTVSAGSVHRVTPSRSEIRAVRVRQCVGGERGNAEFLGREQPGENRDDPNAEDNTDCAD